MYRKICSARKLIAQPKNRHFRSSDANTCALAVSLFATRKLADLQLLTVIMTTVTWDELPYSLFEERTGTYDINELPGGAKYIKFCGNRVFISDPKITDELRVKYRRYRDRWNPTGYVSTDHYIDSTDYTSATGERPRMNV